MAFNLSSANVHRSVDPPGVPTGELFQLEHIDLPYTPADIPQVFPADPDGERRLAAAYFEHVRGSEAFDIPPGPLTFQPPLLPNFPAPQPIGTVYRLAERKSLHGHTVFSIAHTHFGLPVWQSGLAITMSRGPSSAIVQPRITSSHSTIYLHENLTDETRFGSVPNPPLAAYPGFAFMPNNIDEIFLGAALGADPNAIKIQRTQLLIYLYDESTRVLGGIPSGSPMRESFQGNLPELGVLRAINPVEIFDKTHYVVSEVVFSTRGVANRGQELDRELIWRAFIEVEHGDVLYLRPLVAGCFQTIFLTSAVTHGQEDSYGKVFAMDPVTTEGANAYAYVEWDATFTDLLDSATVEVNLQNLEVVGTANQQAVVGEANQQTLSGYLNRYVRIDNSAQAPYIEPAWDPPVVRTADGADFTRSVDVGALPVNEFTNISAYFQCDLLFQMLEKFGFDETEIKQKYFRGKTVFPITVDPQGTDQLLDAEVYPDASGDGVRGIAFGPIQTSRIAAALSVAFPVGNASDPRVVAHEFSHVLLLGSTQSLNFTFAHSVGDSLAAILCDPGSLAPDKTNTFPWLSGLNAEDQDFIPRYHKASDDTSSDNYSYGDLAIWGWGGSKDTCDVPGEQPAPGYLREQILSMSMFRLYEALGGSSGDPEKQRFAARYVAYLIVQAIFLASYDRCVPLTKAEKFEAKLEEADADMEVFDDHYLTVRRGAVKKMIRWAFEKQGMFKGDPPDPSGGGAPPPIDAYIDDGWGGEYGYKDSFESTEIWNRNETGFDPLTDGSQSAIAGRPNYIYVRVRNRGSKSAVNATLNAYFRVGADAKSLNWDGSWTPMGSTLADASGFQIDPGQDIIIGPLEWTPDYGDGNVCVLMSVSVPEGDQCVLDALQANSANPIPLWWLVPADNNIGVLLVSVLG